MSIESQIQGNIARITMSGRFDFELQHAFKSTYAPLIKDEDVHQIEIELAQVEYLDSSALGMLMLLNERARGSKKSMTLLNPSGVASHVLEVANFNHLFTISHAGSAA
ncbi:MAG: STAS domain-containing protein [Gallionella sp.]|jgi:anti-anti-sigma factor